jgi:hypothetical protein
MGRYDNLGLYDNGKVFGIHMYINDYEGEHINVAYEKKYDELMSDEQKKEAYLFYTLLNNKTDIHFKYYTECTSTYEEGTFFMWYPMSLNSFLEKFGGKIIT